MSSGVRSSTAPFRGEPGVAGQGSDPSTRPAERAGRVALQIMRVARDDRAAVDEARALLERQVSHMVRLIDDLKDVSRITRGKLELRKERVELAAILTAAADTSRPLLERSDHKLTLKLPSRSTLTPTRPVWPRSSRTCSTTPPSTPNRAAPSR